MSDLSPIASAEFFQLGYVTGDLSQAIELWRTRYGVQDFFVFDTRDFAPPGSPGPFIKVALGYQGQVMVELIEPDPVNSGIYGDALRADGGVQLHHLGYLVDENAFDGMKERFEQQGSAVPRHLTGGPTLLYADTRAENGLYTEVVARTDYMLKFFQNVPPAR